MSSWIADELAKMGHDVIGMDDLSGGFRANVNPNNQRFEKVDVASRIGLTLCEEAAPEVVYHLAANAREGASFFDLANVCRRNLMGFANVLEGAIKGGNLKKVILFSSAARYGHGDPEGPPFDEDTHFPAPVDPYGANKVAMEQCLTAMADVHGFDYTIVVPHNVFGPRQNIRDIARNVLGIWMNSIMRGEPIYIYGDGRQKRAFSYIEDSLPCYVACLEKQLLSGHTINIGGSKEMTILEAAQIVIAAMKNRYKPTPIIHLDKRVREVRNVWCTTQKSKDLAGYSEKHTTEEGIIKMANWAGRLGPQRWLRFVPPIINEHTPKTWVPTSPVYRGGLSKR
jgi:UDP-glucose 4-epimerase